MIKKLLCILSLVVLWATALAATASIAQETRGTILGKVTDPSGAIIPGATVEVLNKAMGTKTQLKTNDVGFYQASFLIPGQYQVVVDAPGFKKTVRDNVEVRVGDRLEIDVALAIGAAEQTITVTTEAPL